MGVSLLLVCYAHTCVLCIHDIVYFQGHVHACTCVYGQHIVAMAHCTMDNRARRFVREEGGQAEREREREKERESS